MERWKNGTAEEKFKSIILFQKISDLCRNNYREEWHLKFTDKNISRKRFFKWAAVIALIPLYKIWQHSIDRKQLFSSQTNEITVSRNLPDGVHFFGKVILIKQNDSYHLLSSKCSHLGCQINKIENDQLVCPCHGSKYDIKGNPLTGPAVEPLEELDFQLDEKNENMTIRFV